MHLAANRVHLNLARGVVNFLCKVLVTWSPARAKDLVEGRKDDDGCFAEVYVRHIGEWDEQTADSS